AGSKLLDVPQGFLPYRHHRLSRSHSCRWCVGRTEIGGIDLVEKHGNKIFCRWLLQERANGKVDAKLHLDTIFEFKGGEGIQTELNKGATHVDRPAADFEHGRDLLTNEARDDRSARRGRQPVQPVP